jgi:hypothetical protein
MPCMVWPGLLGYVFPIHSINAFVTFQVLNLLPDDLVLLLWYVHSHVREGTNHSGENNKQFMLVIDVI